MLTDKIIDKFSKPVSALEDRPRISAAELKAWFDSNSTNECKTSINGIIKELTQGDAASQLSIATDLGSNVEEAIRNARSGAGEDTDAKITVHDTSPTSHNDIRTEMKRIDTRVTENAELDAQQAEAIRALNTGKQDTLTGKEREFTTFDSAGNVVSRNVTPADFGGDFLICAEPANATTKQFLNTSKEVLPTVGSIFPVYFNQGNTATNATVTVYNGIETSTAYELTTADGKSLPKLPAKAVVWCGIANGKMFLVNPPVDLSGLQEKPSIAAVTKTGNDYSSDLSYAEIQALFSQGKTVVAVLSGEEYHRIDSGGTQPNFAFSTSTKVENGFATAKVLTLTPSDVWSLETRTADDVRIATETVFGGVKVIPATENMTDAVGIDENGLLRVSPGGGGGGYVLPPANAFFLGGIKAEASKMGDTKGVYIDTDGFLHVSPDVLVLQVQNQGGIWTTDVGSAFIRDFQGVVAIKAEVDSVPYVYIYQRYDVNTAKAIFTNPVISSDSAKLIEVTVDTNGRVEKMEEALNAVLTVPQVLTPVQQKQVQQNVGANGLPVIRSDNGQKNGVLKTITLENAVTYGTVDHNTVWFVRDDLHELNDEDFEKVHVGMLVLIHVLVDDGSGTAKPAYIECVINAVDSTSCSATGVALHIGTGSSRAVRTEPQALTSAQQEQARRNINALSVRKIEKIKLPVSGWVEVANSKWAQTVSCSVTEPQMSCSPTIWLSSDDYTSLSDIETARAEMTKIVSAETVATGIRFLCSGKPEFHLDLFVEGE